MACLPSREFCHTTVRIAGYSARFSSVAPASSVPPLPYVEAEQSEAGAADGDRGAGVTADQEAGDHQGAAHDGDRKSTRLNSSHSQISYAVFCLKKKKKKKKNENN